MHGFPRLGIYEEVDGAGASEGQYEYVRKDPSFCSDNTSMFEQTHHFDLTIRAGAGYGSVWLTPLWSNPNVKGVCLPCAIFVLTPIIPNVF